MSISSFIRAGSELVSLKFALITQLGQLEAQYQSQAARVHRAKVLTIREILDRPEYRDKGGVKALGPNAEAQQQELERLLNELAPDCDYQQGRAQLGQAEARLAELKLAGQQISANLRHWEQLKDLLEPLLHDERQSQQLSREILSQITDAGHLLHQLNLKLPQELRALADPVVEEEDESIPF